MKFGSFRVSPSILGPLGAEQLSDPALALLELVKNSWDADAGGVEVEIGHDQISISDDGLGMSVADFLDKWLVIGMSNKRRQRASSGGRPLIGEKGLGRLACFALGEVVSIQSSTGDNGFQASIDWNEVLNSDSLSDYNIALETYAGSRGTTITIKQLSRPWAKHQSEVLLDHLRFFTSVPGQNFAVTLRDAGSVSELTGSTDFIENISSGQIEVEVDVNGLPSVKLSRVEGNDLSAVTYRPLNNRLCDASLAGARIKLLFFLRNKSSELTGALEASNATALMDEYAGVRIYLDGINVPPYGIRGDDWAALEKQRTSTGGPTKVPGNSQLYGEVFLSRTKNPQFVITAGRSGFASQEALQSLREYVRWTARSLGTARRAFESEITSGEVPTRSSNSRRQSESLPTPEKLRSRLRSSTGGGLEENQSTVEDTLRAYEDLWSYDKERDKTLRMFAQLASTGIGATSFAHELRSDFDNVSSLIRQLQKPGADLESLLPALGESWASIKVFASLFQVMPVRVRRKKQVLSSEQLRKSVRRIGDLASTQGVEVRIDIDPVSVKVVPAEMDSIMLNLVSNGIKAIKASDNRKSGKIQVGLRSSRSSLIISVSDNGCGVSDKVEKIMYKPLEGGFEEGTGMGLPIVQYLAKQYNGELGQRNLSGPDYSTEFFVILKRTVLWDAIS